MNKEKQLHLKALLLKIEALLPFASDEDTQRFVEAAAAFLQSANKQKQSDDAALSKLMSVDVDDLLKGFARGNDFRSFCLF